MWPAFWVSCDRNLTYFLTFDNSLTKALSLRSEQILDKFTIMQNEEGISELEKNKLSEIQEAIFKAQAELNDKWASSEKWFISVLKVEKNL